MRRVSDGADRIDHPGGQIPTRTFRSLSAVLVILGVAVFLFGIVSFFYAQALLAVGMLLIAMGGAMWPDPAGSGSRVPGVVVVAVGGLLLVGAVLNLVPRDGPVLLFAGLLLLPLGVGLILGELRRYAPESA